jgi:hypothetical protein
MSSLKGCEAEGNDFRHSAAWCDHCWEQSQVSANVEVERQKILEKRRQIQVLEGILWHLQDNNGASFQKSPQKSAETVFRKERREA